MFDSRIVNATFERVEDCTGEKALAGRLMETPERANLTCLRDSGLAYVPFPEITLFDHLEAIFEKWQLGFESGVVVFEDMPLGAADEADPAVRFTSCFKLRFEDAWGLRNAGFLGRFFVWIEYPRVFLNTSFMEFTGFGCPVENVRQVFDSSLGDLVNQFACYSEKVSVTDGGPFFRDLAEHYGRQWALSGDAILD